MPLNVVEADIAAGALVALRFEDGPPSGAFVMPLSAVYPTASPPGPAGRWLIDRLKLEALGEGGA
jgi:DNA-binding transcriptional LysR family regulator